MPPETPAPYDPSPAPQAARHAPVYQSNPFLAAGSGLSNLLRWNAVPAVLSFVALVAALLGVVAVGAALSALAAAGVLITLLAMLALMVLFMAGAGGLAAMAVESQQGQGRTLGEYVRIGFKRLPEVLALAFLMSLLVYGGLLFFIIPGILAITWLAYAFFILFDEGVGPIDAMGRSYRLAQGHFWETLGSVLTSGLLVTNGLLVLAAPPAALAGRYQQLKELKSLGGEPPEVHWLNYLLPVLMFLFIAAYVALFALSFMQSMKEQQKQIRPQGASSIETSGSFEYR